MSELSPSRRLLLALDQATARLEEHEWERTEPIAIIGMGCRLPGHVHDLDSYWRLLSNGDDAITEVPSNRWSNHEWYDPDPDTPGKIITRFGGFLDDIEHFDYSFFGISPREATVLDPQQRLLLEVSWEALENAGQVKEKLAGSSTGVFIGITTNDYARKLTRDSPIAEVDGYFNTGNALNAAPGRLSYFLGLEGPSMAVDTACSSSLVAVHLACQSLRLRECDRALAGGVNVILSPEVSVAISQGRMLAPDGRCKTFDADADGYGRGEGCGVVVLKRYSDARADGDPVVALIRGSAVNQDGASGGFTVPKGSAQQALLRRALSNARLQPAQIQYVEAHGTGTALGDPIEVNALGEVLKEGRSADRPFLLGSVKANIGHLESAAGIAGLIKVALALKQGKIPPHRRVRHANPHIAWERIPVKVPTELTPWVAEGTLRLAGVSSFGASGTNAHVVLEEAPTPELLTSSVVEQSLHLLALSARTPEALRELAAYYISYFAENPEVSFADVCFSANTGRSHMSQRLAIIASNPAEAVRALKAFLSGREEVWPQGCELRTLAESYMRGDPVDWLALNAGHARTRVPLPTYPWQRERCWVDGTKEESTVFRDWLYQVEWRELKPGRLATPSEVVAGLWPEASELEAQQDLAAYYEAMRGLEDLSVWYAARALEHTTVVSSQYGRLLGRLREMVEDAGTPKSIDPKAELARLRALCPAAEAELTLLERCGSALAEVMQGQRDPLPLLFPEGDLSTANRLYQDSPGARVMNSLVGKAVAGVLRNWPADRRLRVLEIGAGTGGTTAYVLPELRTEATEYAFTDISPRFLNDAEEKFGNVRGEVLDIERSPAAQGFAGRQYDLIIAANVLHATRNLRESLRHVRELLAPGGALVLLEGTEPVRFIDLIFGLTEGWWRFEDRDLRPSHPLLSAEKWTALLEESGFQQAAALSAGREGEGVLSRQAVIVAQAPIEVRQEPGGWLVLADEEGVGEELARLLGSRGETCTLVFAHDQQWNFEADALRGVVHLRSLDEAEQVCGSALRLVQELVKRAHASPPRLTLVTRGALKVTADSDVRSPGQSPLWGLGKIVSLEHPEFQTRLVDLDEEPVAAAARKLFETVIADDPENQVAFRNNVRYAARLAQYSGAKTSSRPIRVHHQGTYLITGGLGGLGLLVADWLISRGAKTLALVGRNRPTPEAKVKLSAMTAAGARVIDLQADVSVQEDVERALNDIARTMPPLRGIIHAAGVLDDAILTQQDWPRFSRVMEAKVAGAWHLYRATQGRPLDFFVLFSSGASLLGSPGQANHAAANAFLDSFAPYVAANGVPAMSINWGAWAEIGAAAARNVSDRIAATGLLTIPPAQGLQALEFLFAHPSTQVGVLPIDWLRFIEGRESLPFLQDFRRKSDTAGAPRSEFLAELNEAPARKRRDLVAAHVEREVTRVLGLKTSARLDPQQGFFELGMDSLTSMELKNRLQKSLGINLPSTLTFDYPTPGTVVDFLMRELPLPKDTASVAPPENGDMASLDALSREHLGSMIDAVLLDLEKRNVS